MLSSRMMLILKELMAAKAPITSKTLAELINVTSRTIRNDIKELNDLLITYGAQIKSTRGIGYELVIEKDHTFKQFLQKEMSRDSFSSPSPNKPEDRVHYILKRLLLNTCYIKLDDVADELYISKSTLQHDLIEVKKILKDFHLELVSKPYYGVKVHGNEMNVRFCISENLLNRKEITVEIENQVEGILPKEDLHKIHRIILDEVKANDIHMSDIALQNLSIHFGIACKRIRDENYVTIAPDDFEGIYKQNEYNVAKQIVSKIESALNVTFPKSEIAYIAIHLLGTKRVAEINVAKQEFESFVADDLRDAIKEIIRKIDDRLQLRLIQDQELFIALGLHLQPAINRVRFGMNIRNPMLEEIKTKYPLAFDAAILASEVLKEKLGIDIDEDEIGYIALHIGVAMYRQRMNQDIKRCIIVCASGSGSAMLLKYKLQQKYFSQLIVADTIEYYRLSEASLEQIDFIVTTIPIEDELPVPVIYVNTFLGENDLRNIENYLQDRNEKIMDFLKEDLIFLQEELSTKEDVIQFLVNQLEAAGYVDSFFRSSVMERERLSPTSFGNLVAIPHPMEPLTKDTFWTICTLKKPIDWTGNRVQFVCLLSVGKNKTADMKQMYDTLIEIIENESKVRQLLSCEEKDEFIQTINTIL